MIKKFQLSFNFCQQKPPTEDAPCWSELKPIFRPLIFLAVWGVSWNLMLWAGCDELAMEKAFAVIHAESLPQSLQTRKLWR